MPTTRPTSYLGKASIAARAKPEYASSTSAAWGSAGTSQKTASAPANASASTSGSRCEPRTISVCRATPAGSRAGSRTTTRTAAPSASRFWTTWRPMPPVGAVTTIILSPHHVRIAATTGALASGPAVDAEHDAGHERGAVAEQPGRGLRYLVGVPLASQRRPGDQAVHQAG